ncbi:hypothetical protein ACQ4PT_071762 [Festuca glaucescens]
MVARGKGAVEPSLQLFSSERVEDGLNPAREFAVDRTKSDACFDLECEADVDASTLEDAVDEEEASADDSGKSAPFASLKDWSDDSDNEVLAGLTSDHDDPTMDAAAPRQPASSMGAKQKPAPVQLGASSSQPTSGQPALKKARPTDIELLPEPRKRTGAAKCKQVPETVALPIKFVKPLATLPPVPGRSEPAASKSTPAETVLASLGAGSVSHGASAGTKECQLAEEARLAEVAKAMEEATTSKAAEEATDAKATEEERRAGEATARECELCAKSLEDSSSKGPAISPVGPATARPAAAGGRGDGGSEAGTATKTAGTDETAGAAGEASRTSDARVSRADKGVSFAMSVANTPAGPDGENSAEHFKPRTCHAAGCRLAGVRGCHKGDEQRGQLVLHWPAVMRLGQRGHMPAELGAWGSGCFGAGWRGTSDAGDDAMDGVNDRHTAVFQRVIGAYQKGKGQYQTLKGEVEALKNELERVKESAAEVAKLREKLKNSILAVQLAAKLSERDADHERATKELQEQAYRTENLQEEVNRLKLAEEQVKAVHQAELSRRENHHREENEAHLERIGEVVESQKKMMADYQRQAGALLAKLETRRARAVAEQVPVLDELRHRASDIASNASDDEYISAVDDAEDEEDEGAEAYSGEAGSGNSERRGGEGDDVDGDGTGKDALSPDS